MAAVIPPPPPPPVNSLQERGPTLQIHELTSASTDEEVRRIMALSARVFAHAPADPNKHTSFDFWRSRLAQPHAAIWFVTRPDDPEPLGFFFNLPRRHKEFEFETLHIWLAGVVEEARGLGIFPLLLEKTKERARGDGLTVLTVATLPALFVRMYELLRRHGWVVVTARESDQSVLMKMEL